MSIVIRQLRADDRQKLIALEQSCPDSEVAIESLIDGAVSESFKPSVIAQQDGELIGAVICSHTAMGFACHIFVSPSTKQVNLAKQMMDKTLLKLIKAGNHRCHIVLNQTQADGAFWDSAGWMADDKQAADSPETFETQSPPAMGEVEPATVAVEPGVEEPGVEPGAKEPQEQAAV